jgi:DNA-directed RNA polymerase subunit beta'
MNRSAEVVLRDFDNREKARYRLPYGARLLVEADHQVNAGQRLAEWDPYTLPIITEKSGVAHYVDLIEGLSMREILDETTGLSNRVVIDWKQQARGNDLKPRITLRDADGNVLTLDNGLEARYFMSVDSILNVPNGATVQAGDVLGRIPRESSKTRDITGGLPRVAELFEARKAKDHAIMAETAGRIEFGKDNKTKRKIIITPEAESAEPVEYTLPKGRHLAVREGDFVEIGDLLVDGNPVPHDILRIKGIEALADYLINEIQDVYRLQGVKINDKHIEVIIRQMLQKVDVIDQGESTFLVGEQVDKITMRQENTKLLAEGKRPAVGEPVLQGITKASLQTHSFISAASFQETTRVLTESATAGRVDYLMGLKENVIVGRLIPAGTGSVYNRYRSIARQRDYVTAQPQAITDQYVSLGQPSHDLLGDEAA